MKAHEAGIDSIGGRQHHAGRGQHAKAAAEKLAKLDRTAQVYILGDITARLLCKQNGNKTA